MKDKLGQQEFFQSLKKTGFAVEQHVNQLIQNVINHEDVVKLADAHSEAVRSHLKLLQKYGEVLSTILRLPSKDDVANVAKLTIQVEEKVDKLEEFLGKLPQLLEKVKDAAEVRKNLSDMKKEPVKDTKGKSIPLNKLLQELEAANKAKLNELLSINLADKLEKLKKKDK
jgi:hypothetical protein